MNYINSFWDLLNWHDKDVGQCAIPPVTRIEVGQFNVASSTYLSASVRWYAINIMCRSSIEHNELSFWAYLQPIWFTTSCMFEKIKGTIPRWTRRSKKTNRPSFYNFPIIFHWTWLLPLDATDENNSTFTKIHSMFGLPGSKNNLSKCLFISNKYCTCCRKSRLNSPRWQCGCNWLMCSPLFEMII